MSTPQDIITTAELVDDWPQAASFTSSQQANLVTRASRWITNYCDRQFGSANYTEVHRPGRTRKVYTRQSPITAITRIGTDLATVLTLQCQDTTCARVTAGYTSPGTPEEYLSFTGLTLTEIRGSGNTTHSFPFATYTTIGSIATAVNALGNWTATVSSNTVVGSQVAYDGWPSTDLAPDVGQMGAQLLSLELKAYTRDLPYACDVDLARQGVIELFEGRPDGYQYPDRRANWGYGYGGLSGITGGFDPRVGAVWVSYTAGFATADMPPDLKSAALLLARYIWGRSQGNLAMQSESYRDYSYTRADTNSWPGDVIDIIDQYARKEIL